MADKSNNASDPIIERVKKAKLSIRKILPKEKECCVFEGCKGSATVYMEAFYLCDNHAEKFLENFVSNKK